MSYDKKLKSPKWQRKRLKIMDRDNFSCCICGDNTSSLNVHHLFYDKEIKQPYDYPDDSLLTVCDNCHNDIHSSKIGAYSLILMNLFVKLTDSDRSFVNELISEINRKKVIYDMTEKEAIKITLLEYIRNS